MLDKNIEMMKKIIEEKKKKSSQKGSLKRACLLYTSPSPRD